MKSSMPDAEKKTGGKFKHQTELNEGDVESTTKDIHHDKAVYNIDDTPRQRLVFCDACVGRLFKFCFNAAKNAESSLIL